jgi:hypothetical protein
MALTPGTCTAASIAPPLLPDVQIRSLDASLVRVPYQFIPAGVYSNSGSVTATNLQYCNVTITYVSSESRNRTTVQIWLPSGPTKWNGRMQGIGGSGWSAGLTDFGEWTMAAAVAQGYAAVATNAGWETDEPRDWAYSSPGVVDRGALHHYGSGALNHMSIMGKSVVASFYGRGPRYSYFNGCSQGGRQGFALAQEYPTAFDGIAASAPPVNWSSLMVAGFWAQATMNDLAAYPTACELSALTAAAVRHCDPLDGVVDGLVSDPDSCSFDPYSLVGSMTSCVETGGPIAITRAAAEVARIGWGGMVPPSNQSFMTLGTMHEASLVTAGAIPLVGGLLPMMNITMGLADRRCKADGSSCLGKPNRMVDDWIKVFILRQPNFNSSTIGVKEFDEILERSVKEYASIIGTTSTNLTAFRDAGGKLVSYHGLVSFIIIPFFT